MAYDEHQARRIGDLLAGQPGLVEKRMFGGVGFIVQGNMACGLHKDGLIVRVGPQRYEEALARPGTRPFDMTGKPMAGWVLVQAGSYEEDDLLREWVDWGLRFALSLPSK
jgi:TfoX/Sxy family transcriptional regulator of competence genes